MRRCGLDTQVPPSQHHPISEFRKFARTGGSRIRRSLSGRLNVVATQAAEDSGRRATMTATTARRRQVYRRSCRGSVCQR
jgi:hypothetical protein